MRNFSIYFIFLGIFSLFSQVILIREILVNFYGNELFIGFTFFSWLSWTFLGSFLFEKLPKPKKIENFLIVFPLILLFQITLLRLLNIFNKTGELPSIFKAILLSFFSLAPLCFLLGFSFPLFFSKLKGNSRILFSQAYFFETLGFVIAGLFFNFFFFKFLEVYCLIFLFFLTALTLFILKKIKLSLIATALMIFLSFFGHYFSFESSKFKYPGKILEIKNTPYQRIVITKISDQVNFYGNGNLLATNQEKISAEIFHFPFLYSPNPKKIILIGKGEEGVIEEILKEEPEKLVYFLSDPYYLKIISKYLKNYYRKENLELFFGSFEEILKRKEKFDIFILKLPLPTTLSLNRFYTKEFFKKVKKALSKNGLFFIINFSTPSLKSPSLAKINSLIFHTLKAEFKYILFQKQGENLFYFASDYIDFSKFKKEHLIEKLIKKGFLGNYFNPGFFSFLETKSFKEKEEVNSIFKPQAFLLGSILKFSFFSKKIENLFLRIMKFNFSTFLFCFLFFFFLLLIFSFKTRKIFLCSIASASFSLMTLELLFIFLYQTFFGNIFYKISLFVSLFMLGMVFGTKVGISLLRKKKGKKFYLALTHFSFGFLSLTPLFFGKNPFSSSLLLELSFYLTALLIGSLLGIVFSIGSELWKNSGGSVAKFYSFDILGGAFGTLLPTILLLPIFGFKNTTFLLVLINLSTGTFLLKK